MENKPENSGLKIYPEPLKTLNDLVNSKTTLLGKESLPLLNKLNQLNAYRAYVGPSAENEKLGKSIADCAGLMIVALNPRTREDQIAALMELEVLLNSDAFEIKTHEAFWRELLNSGFNKIVNPIRRVFARTPFQGKGEDPIQRARFNNINVLEQEMRQFINSAQLSSTSYELSDFEIEVNVDEQTVKMSPAVEKSYSGLLEVVSSVPENIQINPILMTEFAKASELVNSLKLLSLEVEKLKSNQVMYPAAKQALIANQTMIIELFEDMNISAKKMHEAPERKRKTVLKELKKTTKRMDNIQDCIAKSIAVMQDPGNGKKTAKLEEAINNGDYLRFRRNKEQSTYSALHAAGAGAQTLQTLIPVTMTLLKYGFIGLVNPIALAFIISAEIANTATGIGQINLHGKSVVINTLYFNSMQGLVESGQLHTADVYWLGGKSEIIKDKLGQVTMALSQPQAEPVKRMGFFHKPTNQNQKISVELVQLNQAIEDLRAIIAKEDAIPADRSLIIGQAKAVLEGSEDVMFDILHSDKLNLKRITKLRECIEASTNVVNNPSNIENLNKLTNILSKKEYETRKIIKSERLYGSFLILASLVFFAVAIPATIITLGGTAAILPTPIMIMCMGIQTLCHSYNTKQTALTRQAKALAGYAQLESLAPKKREELLKHKSSHLDSELDPLLGNNGPETEMMNPSSLKKS